MESRILMVYMISYITSRGINAQTVPVISPWPNATVTENDNTTLTCRYSPNSGCPTQLLFEWLKNDSVTLLLAWNNPDCYDTSGNTSLPFSCSVDETGACVVTVTLTQVRNNQHGDQWHCLAAGNVSKKTNISVQVPISSVQMTYPTSDKVSVVENVPYRFQCETSPSRPLATIKWYKQLDSSEEEEVTSVVTPGTETNGTLTIRTSSLNYTSSKRDEGWKVYCRASYVASLTLTSTRKPGLTILYPPSITVTDKSVVVGSPLNITCQTDPGNPIQTSYKWTRSTSSSWSRTGDTLTIPSVKKDDVSDYTCTAWNVMTPTGGTPQNGSVTVTFTLDVLYPPTIRAISDKSVVLGSPLTVTCQSDPGNPSQTSYRWTRSTNSTWSRTEATLTIPSVQKADVGDYTCTAWNVMTPTGGTEQNGEETEAFTLDVLYPPTITAITDKSKVVDSLLNITCQTDPGNPSQTLYKWTRSTSSTWNRTGATLTIPSVQKDDASDYTCTAWNVMSPTGGTPQNGSVTVTFTLDVLYQASITRFRITEETGTGPYTMDENSTGTFQCLVESNPGSDLTIRGPQGVLAQKGNTRNITHPISFGCLDAGMYECRGYNYLNGADTPTESLQLHVRCHPRPSCSVEPIIKVYKALRDPVTLNVSFIAYPPPTFRWFKQRPNGSDVYDPIPSETQGTFTIDDLKEADFRQYKVEVANNITPNYEQVYIVEVQDKPETPRNITVEWNHNFAVVQWLPGFNGGLTQTFFIEYRKKVDPGWSLVDAGEETTGMFNKTLEQLLPGTDYVFRMYAENSYNKSQVSKETSFKTLAAPESSTPLPLGAIAGGAVGGVAAAIIVVVVIVLFLRRRKQTTRKDKSVNNGIDVKRNDADSDKTKLGPKYENIAFEGAHLEEEELEEGPLVSNTVQPRDENPYYSNARRPQTKFSKQNLMKILSKSEEEYKQEFEFLPSGLIKSFAEAVTSGNAHKNRYKRIYPYDDSRVKVAGADSDYINASYINGYKKKRAYIAAQGPTTKNMGADFAMFWKMVWQEKVETIVMVTKLHEVTGAKCDQYWPNVNMRSKYAEFEVHCAKEEVFAEFVVRSLTIKKGKDTRHINHVNFTAWPDKGVPHDVISIINLRHKVDKMKKMFKESPLLVHCSAGVGRTGTYIALDILTNQGYAENEIDVFECVVDMRQNRTTMVQTLEQYKFLHHAVLWTLTSDIDPLPSDRFVDRSWLNDHKLADMFNQLQIPNFYDNEEERLSIADNKKIPFTNRPGADIPGRRHGVSLMMNEMANKSSYINAVYIDGYKTKERFIAAMTPLPDTVFDFLGMLLQENVTCVIDLTPLDSDQQDIGEYLPADNQDIENEAHVFRITAREVQGCFVKREVEISKKKKGKKGDSKTLHHFQFTKWNANAPLPHSADFVTLVNAVDTAAIKMDITGPIVVHCLSGAKRSGLFCAVWLLIERMTIDRAVSVLNTLRQVKTRRRGAIPNKEQIDFCFECVDHHLKYLSERVYSNTELQTGGREMAQV